MNQLQYLNGFGIASGVASAMVLVAQPAWAQGTAITNVQLQKTDRGIEVILETPTGEQPRSFSSSDGETLVIHFTNTQLAGEEFLEENPIAGIASVEVTQQYTNTVRVKLVGTENLPKAEVTTTEQGIALNVTAEVTTAQEPAPGPETEETTPDPQAPTAQEPETEEPAPAPEPQEPETKEPIELVVTATRPTGEQYQVDRATTGTRTNTPLRDIPQSIQVVPKEVIEDQQATDLSEIVRNVSGITQADSFGGTRDTFNIRGFRTRTFLRNGFRSGSEIKRIRETANLERVEVLKGPASVLHGRLQPGGVINTVTEKPTEEPFFSLEPRVGSFGLVEPSIDMSGHLNESETLSYRLNALYETKDGFRNFDQDFERTFISPVLSWDISDSTNLTLEFEYIDDERPFDRGLVAKGGEIADIPFDRILQEPDDFNETQQFLASYKLEHQFNDNLKLRHRFQFLEDDRINISNEPSGNVSDNGELERYVGSNDELEREIALQTNLVGNFQTGSIEHDVLFGVDYNHVREQRTFRSTNSSFDVTTINIFDPVYDDGTPSRDELDFVSADVDNKTDSVGIYLQDQIDLSEQFKVLLGGRLDFVDQEEENLQNNETATQYDEVFSPRIGLVYQPSDSLSLYGSFSESFIPNDMTGPEGEFLEPERGTQYEAGLRAEFLDGDLSLNLAAFNITKQNIAVSVPGPGNANVNRAIGEEESRGIELDLAGEITDGWKIIATYAHTDTEVTEDEMDIEGNQRPGVPKDQASLWTTYEIQQGNLQGLEFGAGVFFVGDRKGNRENNIELPSYARVDARLAYSRNNWEASVNFKNLFDADIVQSQTSFGKIGLQPGIPFTVIGSFSVEF